MSLYLYSGPEFGGRDDAVLALKNSLRKKFSSCEFYSYYSVETPIADAMQKLYGASLFSDATCVVFHGAEQIKKKEDVQKIADWAKSASDSSVLILVSDEISCDAKLEKIVPKECRRQFWEMYEKDKIPWLKNYFSKNGYSIENDACEEILELVENNTQALRNECSRFFVCFPQGAKITVENVDSLIEHGREESAFTLFDAMSDGARKPSERLESALGILQKIRLSKDSSSVMIISGLSYCFRRLSAWHALKAAGKTDEPSLNANGFASKKSRRQCAAAERVWNQGQSAAICALLSETDMQIRSGGAGLEDTLLQMLLYEIITKRGARIAAYS